MKRKYSIYIFITLTLLYFLITVGLPVDKATLVKYQISQSSAKLLSLTIVVPLIVVWGFLYYGFDKLRNYALAITTSKDGEAFYDISTGLMVMVFSFPVTAVASALMSYYIRTSPHLTEEFAIIRNYINLIFPLIAFYNIRKGSHKLHSILKRQSTKYSSYIGVFFILISSIFTWHVMSQFYVPENARTVYYLPQWLVMATLVLPYLYTWYTGVYASLQIYQYKSGVKGIVYQKALTHFVAGLLVIVGLSVVMQFILASSSQLNRLNLSPVLLILYSIVFLNVVGYGLVVSSVKKLTTIEES